MARSIRFSLLLLLLVWFGLDAWSLAQAVSTAAAPVERITVGNSTEPLYGPWKFHIGDSPLNPVTHAPLWAEPDFDDSQWETVDLTPQDKSLDPIYGISGMVPGWTVRGHARHWGYAWYRIRVQVAAPAGEKLALAGPSAVDDGYQVLQDGNLLGSFGGFSTLRPVIYSTQPMVFALPESPDGSPTTRLLAFRVWMESSTLKDFPNVGGLRTAPLLGEAGAVAANYQLLGFEHFRADAHLILLAMLFGLLAIMAFNLILFDRSDQVYVWLGATFLLIMANDTMTVLVAATQHLSVANGDLIRLVILRPLMYAAWVMVWWNWFGLHRPSWLPRAAAALTLLYALSTAMDRDLFFTAVPHPLSSAFSIMYLVTRWLFPLLTLVCVVYGIRRVGLEGWSVLPAVILWGIAQFSSEFQFLSIHLNWFPFGVQVTLGDIANLLLAFVIAGLLLRRLLGTVRLQRLMELDVKQAQEVRRVILPEAIASLPGLAIESEYRPAREVGGDFFQIIPHLPDGSLLIVAGDVTGKGLQAGMLVALLVGAIRTSAQFDLDPLSVLNILNQRLWGRSEASATCLALRIAADGEATLANAGHVPPYLNCEPLEIAGSLPLGIVEDAAFSVMRFRLTVGDHLLMMSDGIAEATDPDGNLFGFERVLDMVRNSASAAVIATAAQKFGQEDDISVISIVRTAA
ncbi:MAG TPA: PP2C family protein-serine/threonine phosphatase [Edaphobacter sp.]|nr:PP2C family protein-serine/threonine phosphatase [Edaphobacter sp.]